MVANITSPGSSAVGALYYNKDKIDKEKAALLFCKNTLHPMSSDGSFRVDQAMESFQPYLDANRRTKFPVFHVSLNPSANDRLSDGDLSEIAEKYMERMGYGEQPYFVFKHTDIDRVHLHVVSLRIDREGRKLDHDMEAKRSMPIVRALEQEYNLEPAEKGKEQGDKEEL